MGYVNSESAKAMPRVRLFEKKLSLLKEVALFSLISFKKGFYWYREILQFSGIFGLKSVICAIAYVL